MKRILFVCHGNICRSPMAEYIFNDMVKKRGITGIISESAATSTEELGNGVHRGTSAILRRLGIDCSAKRARLMNAGDLEKFDLIIGMDSANIRNIKRIAGEKYNEKIFRLLDFSDDPRDISDPWYTGDFESTYRDVAEGCEGILKRISDKEDQFLTE